jgi:hypothetical protein
MRSDLFAPSKNRVDNMLPFGESSFREAVSQSAEHYHQERDLQALDNKIIRPEFRGFPAEGSVHRRKRFGGLLNCYYRKADESRLVRFCGHYGIASSVKSSRSSGSLLNACPNTIATARSPVGYIIVESLLCCQRWCRGREELLERNSAGIGRGSSVRTTPRVNRWRCLRQRAGDTVRVAFSGSFAPALLRC